VPEGQVGRTLRIFLQAIGFALYFSSAWAQNAQFHAGPSHQDTFPEAGPDGFFIPSWRFDAGHMVVASPVISAGVLYAGAKNGRFFALDSKTGARKWVFQADAAITSTAAVGDGRIFFETDANTIYALDLDGHELWHRATGGDLPFDAMAGFQTVEDWDYWASSPLLEDGELFAGSGDGKIYALDAATGKEIWTFATQGRVRSSPASDGKTIYAGSFDGRLYALDRKTGKLRWSFQTLGNKVFPQGSIQSSPTLAEGFVLFGARDYNLYALDAKTGREVWHQSVKNSWVPSTPAVDKGSVYTGSADGRAAFAYDLKTGKLLWTTPLDNLVFSSPVIARGRLYLATMGGSVFAMDAQTGKIVGYTLTEDRVLSTPWIEDGTIYFGNNDGFIYAMRAGPHRYPGG
jgi:outer membrane protein assembly factor BamB